MHRLPAVITGQGKETEELSKKRRQSWLAVKRRKDIKLGSYVYIRVCSDHVVCGKPCPLYETTNPDWVPSLRLGHNGSDSKLTGNTSRYDRASARAAKRRKVCELFDKDLDRKDNEEEIVQREVVQSGDDEVQQLGKELQKTRSELDVVKAELARASEELRTSRYDCYGTRTFSMNLKVWLN